MLKRLTKRLEALEKRAVEIRETEQEIAELAFSDVGADVELLLSVYRAERDGRPLTEQEVTVRKSYYAAAKRRYEHEKIRPPTDLARIFDIRLAIEMAIVWQCDLDIYDLSVGYDRALKEGRAPTEKQCAAHQAYADLEERLCQRAGFTSWEAVLLELGPIPWKVDDNEPR